MEILKRIYKLKYLLLIILVWIIFAFPYLILGKTPYPSDYQVNSFQPWAQYPVGKGPVKNNAQPDIIGQIYPWRFYSVSELKQGNIPFWNPYSFSGTPHLANYQSAVFSVYNILFFLPLKFITIWGFLVVLQPLLAGIFTYLFTRSLGLTSKGSLQSAFAFMFCGFLVTWMGYATLAFAILPLPLALLASEKYIKTNKLYYGIILSASIPLSFYSGHFQTSLYFLAAVIFYILFLSVFHKRTYINLLWYLACGILLCSPQILPSIEFYTLSVRSFMFQKVEAIPWTYLPTLIAPDYFGNPVTRNDWFGHYAEWSGYAGAVALILAGFSLKQLRNKKIMFFVILAASSLLLAFDTPLLSALVSLELPVLSTSAASRIIVLFSFSIAILSGFGFDYIFSKIRDKRYSLILVCLVIVLIGIISILPFAGFLESQKSMIAKKNMILPVAVSLITIGLITLHLIVKRKKVLVLLPILLLLVSGMEMLRFSTKWQSFSHTSNVYSAVPITKFYDSQNGIDRVLGLSGGEDSLYYKVPIVTGYDPLYIADYGEFIQHVATGKIDQPGRSVVGFPTSGLHTKEAINFLGIKFVVHKLSDKNYSWAFPFKNYPSEQFTKVYDDKVFNVFRNNSAFNRAFLVGNVKVESDKSDVGRVMFDNDLSSTAVVVEDLNLSGSGMGDVKITNYQPEKIELKVNSNGSNLLVLTDNYYPGWKAYINGNLAKIYKTNYTFRGVVVPNGESRVVFSYFPQSFLIGTYLFALGLLGIICAAVLRQFKR